MNIKYTVFLIFIISITGIGCGSIAENPSPKSSPSSPPSMIEMPWKLTDYYILPNASWGKTDANKLVFKEAFISKNSIRFNEQTCNGVFFKRTSISLSEYLNKRYHASTDALKLSEQHATLISTNCSLSGFDNYIQLDDQRVIIFINGIAFFLMPSIAY